MTGENVRDDPLSAVRIFADLSEEWRSRLHAAAQRRRLAAGEWLFRAGDPGLAMYVVLSGRLEVLLEEPEPVVIRILDRDSAVGELALLTGRPRSASVRARRDSELLELTADHFAELIRDQTFAVELLRALGEQLQASRGLDGGGAPRPATISVVPSGSGLPCEAVGSAIATELGRLAPTAVLDAAQAGADPSGFGPLLDRLEHDHAHVVLQAGAPPGDPFTDFCLRQGDRRYAVVDGEPGDADADALAGCEPLCSASGPGRLGPWLDALGAPQGRVLSRDPASAAGAIARAAAGRSLGLVLSGGGARGLAHIGVLEELCAAGVEVDRVGGCSMGAVIGGMFASGRTPAEIRRVCESEFEGRNPLGDYTVPLVALIRGERAKAMGERIYGDRLIEELPRRFFTVSCDLVSSGLVVHRRGLLYEGVGASMALPGIFPPVEIDGRFLIDGGVLNNLPVEAMAASGEGPVIASDVTARFEMPVRRRRRDSVERVREAVTGLGSGVPFGFREIMMRTVVLGSIDTAEVAQSHAELVIEPAVEAIGMMAFESLAAAVDAGRRAAAEALEANPDFVELYAS